MSRSGYYQAMRTLALEKRAKYKIATASLNLRSIQHVYKEEGIRIDLRDMKCSRIRAAYFCDNNDYSVLVNKNLPREPKLFALVHELKHHFADRETIQNGQIKCGDYNANEIIEIGAEVFAAEFIYPETEMQELATHLGITNHTCLPESVVQFKRACPVPVSYKFIVKRFEWFGFCAPGQFKQERFQKLEEKLHGIPIYKQPWFQRHRLKKKAQSLVLGKSDRTG
ncbi:MAG: ImmA/IrrE family metallo-endopeptidase [Nitrospiraceae bacterium]